MKRNIIPFLIFLISTFILVWKVEAKDRKMPTERRNIAFYKDFEGVAYNRINYKLSEIRFNYILMDLGFKPEGKYQLAYYSNQSFKNYAPCLRNGIAFKRDKEPDIIVKYKKNYSMWPRAWFGLSQDVAPTGISTTIQLFFYREASKLGLSIKPLNYPLELQTQPKENLLGMWQEAEIMCTFCFPF